jgi:hypothetical protein
MAANESRDEPKKRFTKTQMLLGAAGLLLFIVGVKRTMRTPDGAVVPADGTPEPKPEDA